MHNNEIRSERNPNVTLRIPIFLNLVIFIGIFNNLIVTIIVQRYNKYLIFNYYIHNMYAYFCFFYICC